MSAQIDPDPDAIAGGEIVGVPSLSQGVRALAGVFKPRPAVAAELKQLPNGVLRILNGQSQVVPSSDRRFSDPGWDTNPLFRRLVQAYLAGGAGVQRLLDDLETAEADPRKIEQARFAAEIAIAALSPSNLILTNPVGLKHAFDTAGGSLARGAANFIHDMRHNGWFPSTVDRTTFEVGRDLAVSPGAVVARDDMAELIQYSPSTAKVKSRPLLVIPPPIGRYYFLDLRPGRSFVEFATSQGLQVFLISWRNPGPAQGDWGLDDYAVRVSTVLDTVLEITGQTSANLIGFCAGGLITTALLNHMAASGDDRVHSMSYGVTLLDFERRAPLSAFKENRLLDFVKGRSGRRGVITSHEMGAAFTLMRPNDLVFNYVVNNYVLGNKPPAFDILAWNADGTNLPSKLHADFLSIFRDNGLVTGKGLTVLNSAVDLARITVPVFVTGALTDHLTPWKGCYQTTQLVGGETTFVLSYSGHIASLVNPPGNPKARYWTGGEPGPDPDAWRVSATEHQGSWWEAWADWIEPHTGVSKTAPKVIGSPANPALEPTPGRYVRARPAS
ncbi:PHA/PHB synthase family protein [Monashia sp. NPDC004114]